MTVLPLEKLSNHQEPAAMPYNCNLPAIPVLRRPEARKAPLTFEASMSYYTVGSSPAWATM